MNGDAIREWLNREPFAPFVLQMSDGKAHEVRQPENLALGKAKFVFIDPQTDRAFHLALNDISAVARLHGAP